MEYKMHTKDAVSFLLNDPMRFLQKNALVIAGGSTRPSGLSVWRLYLEKENYGVFAMRGPDWEGTRKVLLWRAMVTNGKLDEELSDGTMGSITYSKFLAYYVAMKQINDGPDNTHFHLPGGSAHDFMLTSQLTGCTFGMGSQTPGSGCLVSHIQPPKSVHGTRSPNGSSQNPKLAMRVAVTEPMGPNARFLETDAFVSTSVLGKRVAGTWKFYKQEKDNRIQKITTSAGVI